MGRRKKAPPPLGLGVLLVLAAAPAGYGLVAWLIGPGRPVQIVGWGPPLARPDLEWPVVAPSTSTTPPPPLEPEAPPVLVSAPLEGPFRPRREVESTPRSNTKLPPRASAVPASIATRLPTPRPAPALGDEARSPAHDEALNLLAALEGLARTPDRELEINLEALRNLPASDPRVEVTRERCATAFSDYLSSARKYEEAERGLAEIDVGRPARAVVDRVGEALRQAEAQVARAARSKSLCFAGARSMIAAFPPVRRETVGLAP